MGIRIREEIRQCLLVNMTPKEVRKADSQEEANKASKIKSLEYPLLKPLMFSNPITLEQEDKDVWKLNQKF